MPELSFEVALAGCFVSCSAYAVALTTKKGQEATLSHVWIALIVVLGVGCVLGWIATQGTHDIWTDFLFYVAGGTPMLIRAGYLWLQHKLQVISYRLGRVEAARAENEGSE